jgi:hypothetical protein
LTDHDTTRSAAIEGGDATAASAVNAIYARCSPDDPPARIFVRVPEGTGPFDIEINRVAMVYGASAHKPVNQRRHPMTLLRSADGSKMSACGVSLR